MEKLNFKDFEINWYEEVDVENSSINFYLINKNDKPLEIVDSYRADLGYTDGACSSDNEVYYNFYLSYDYVEEKTKITAVANNSEKDDYGAYDFDTEVSDTDLKHILAKALVEQI